jgi:dipeptidyl aminopeptidase/acylaminoacyl peptidase
VIPHGGPHGVMTNTFLTREALLFTARGWVVFRPNFRGSGNYGERFLRANLGGWGLGDYADVMSGVDRLIAEGVVDGNRMAISGASYGGYMTAWTISQTRRFRAAVVGCAITNVPSFVRSTDVPRRFEDYLGTDPSVYPRHSPMTYGEHIRTPALIWHGDQDQRVPLMQSRELYTQLLKNGTPVELRIYPGEPHGLHLPGYERDLLQREWEWLQKWVPAP